MTERAEQRGPEAQIASIEIRLEKARFYFQVIACWAIFSLALVVVFGWLVIAGLGSLSQKVQIWLLLIAAASLLVAAILLKIQRDAVFSARSELRQMQAFRRSASARAGTSSQSGYEAVRQRYKDEAWEYVEEAREAAARNRRIHNLFQAIIILGSILVTSLTSAMASPDPVNWITILISIFVSASAGLSSYFKFRERGFNLQQTANAIEREYNAVELRINDYGQLVSNDGEAMRVFTERVEGLKDEQRNRELQLEQSADRTPAGAAGQNQTAP